MRRLCLLCLLSLTACTDPQLGLGISLGPNGVAVRPTVSGTVGGVGVGVSGSLE
jgi:hypothetical protein